MTANCLVVGSPVPHLLETVESERSLHMLQFNFIKDLDIFVSVLDVGHLNNL